MKITTKLLKQFIDIDIEEQEIVALIKEHIGEVDFHYDMSNDYNEIVIAEIVEKENHPDAEKLSIYQINYGAEEKIQVVAGDKSLEIGDKVAYLKEGAKIPYTVHTEVKPVTVQKIKLRGIISHGMMASEKELNLGSNHAQVMRLPLDAPVGEQFVEYYDLDDTVIEIENKALTNRGDLFGVLGIAREISAILGKPFHSPDWYIKPKRNIKQESSCLNLKVINDAEALCPRYTAIALDNIEIKDSPIWLKSVLSKCGIKPINNIVDITNYISLVVGQPLHAFDYDKVVGSDPNTNTSAEIFVRMAKDEEKILAIDEKTYELNNKMLVIADSTHPIAIAGIIGGKDTEVDSNTKRIILESANFDKSSIRKTSMKLGILTESATRFKRSLDTEQCLSALVKAIDYSRELSGATVASNVIDIYLQEAQNNSIRIDPDHLREILGLKITNKEIKDVLLNLEYTVKGKDELLVKAPLWRRDIEIKEDIYEDIVRIYGYSNIEPELPKKEIKPPKSNPVYEIKKAIRQVLSNNGANETLTYSFCSPDSFDKTNLDTHLSYKLRNPLSKDLSLIRTTIIQTLLEKGRENLERGFEDFVLYEINILDFMNYTEENNLPIEEWYLSMLITDINPVKAEASAYYVTKNYVELLLKEFHIKSFEYRLVAESTETELPHYVKNLLPIFEPNASAILFVNGAAIGILGEIKGDVRDKYKLPKFTAGLEININELSKLKQETAKYIEQPIYPSFTKDLCFETNDNVSYIELDRLIGKVLSKANLWSRVDCIDIYKDEKMESVKRITFRITGSSYKKTLEEKEIKDILKEIEEIIKKDTGAVLI